VIQSDPMQPLRMAAIREQLGNTVSSDQLIAAALGALLAGVESSALAQLAALGHSEESEAHTLFNRVVEEFALAPSLPTEPTAARWELVRWWCQLIVEEKLPPQVGGRLIWFEGWNKLKYPEALQPLVGMVSEWDDWTEEWDMPREMYSLRIIQAARELLDQPWPPESL